MVNVDASLLQLVLRFYRWRSGRKKLIRALARRCSAPVVWTTADGARLLLDPRNYIDREIVSRGGFEGAAIRYMAEVINHRGFDAFIDVGANIGLYAIAIARTTKAEIVAFEPDPRNRCQMAGNLFLNGLEMAVTLRPEAIAEREADSMLYAQRDGGDLSTGLSSLVERGSGRIEIPVRLASLDRLFDWRDRRIAIKIDIESAELSALLGMTELARRNLVFLQVEIAPPNVPRARGILNGLGLKPLAPPSERFGNHYYVSAGEAEQDYLVGELVGELGGRA